jgi:serine/threonine protein phosphatase PrpC
MPDPHVLYVVVAVVVLGLVAWVVAVLSRPVVEPKPLAPKPAAEPADKPPPKSDKPERKSDVPKSAVEPPATKPEGSKARGKLQSDGDGPDDASKEPDKTLVEEDDAPTGPHALILVTAVARTDPGLKRKNNEDAYAVLEDHHLFVIADGMGRHAAGEVASKLAVEAIQESFTKGDFGSDREPPLPKRAARLRGAILAANARVFADAASHDDHAGMGTTVVAAYFSPNNQRVNIAHVGDSRCYRLRAGKLTQLTRDHTLGEAGIQGKSAAVLSRAVGVEEDLEVDVTGETPLPGDIYLLCSDGLSRHVNAEEIEKVLETTKDLDAASKALIDKANASGGRDNITTILVRVDPAKAG